MDTTQKQYQALVEAAGDSSRFIAELFRYKVTQFRDHRIDKKTFENLNIKMNKELKKSNLYAFRGMIAAETQYFLRYYNIDGSCISDANTGFTIALVNKNDIDKIEQSIKDMKNNPSIFDEIIKQAKSVDQEEIILTDGVEDAYEEAGKGEKAFDNETDIDRNNDFAGTEEFNEELPDEEVPDEEVVNPDEKTDDSKRKKEKNVRSEEDFSNEQSPDVNSDKNNESEIFGRKAEASENEAPHYADDEQSVEQEDRADVSRQTKNEAETGSLGDTTVKDSESSTERNEQTKEESYEFHVSEQENVESAIGNRMQPENVFQSETEYNDRRAATENRDREKEHDLTDSNTPEGKIYPDATGEEKDAISDTLHFQNEGTHPNAEKAGSQNVQNEHLSGINTPEQVKSGIAFENAAQSEGDKGERITEANYRKEQESDFVSSGAENRTYTNDKTASPSDTSYSQNETRRPEPEDSFSQSVDNRFTRQHQTEEQSTYSYSSDNKYQTEGKHIYSDSADNNTSSKKQDNSDFYINRDAKKLGDRDAENALDRSRDNYAHLEKESHEENNNGFSSESMTRPRNTNDLNGREYAAYTFQTEIKRPDAEKAFSENIQYRQHSMGERGTYPENATYSQGTREFRETKSAPYATHTRLANEQTYTMEKEERRAMEARQVEKREQAYKIESKAIGTGSSIPVYAEGTIIKRISKRKCHPKYDVRDNPR